MAKPTKISEYYKIPKPLALQAFNYDFSEKFMVNDLGKSGLTFEDIYARVYPLQKEQILAAYYIVYFDINGNILLDSAKVPLMFRLRQLGELGADPKKTPRYWQPARSEIGDIAVTPYLHPTMWKAKGDATLICEGEKKALCCIKYLDLPSIGIGGMGNWRAAKGVSDKVHPTILAALKKAGNELVYLIPDGDIRRYNIAKEYGTLATLLREEGYEVFIRSLPNEDAKIDDLIVEWGEDALDNFSGLPVHDNFVERQTSLITRYELVFTEANNGRIKVTQCEANYRILISQHPAFADIWYNEDSGMIMMGDKTYDETVDLMDVLVHIQKNLGFVTASHPQVRNALRSVAKTKSRSPFKEYLRSLTWDKQERLPTIFIDYCGSPDTEVVREVGSKWFSASVARMFEPGCILDYMVIAVGAQGIGKSSFPRIIWGKEDTVDLPAHVKGAELQRLIHSGLCINMEELAAMHGKEIEGIKALITTARDKIRPLYTNDPISKPRRSVFYGSVNHLNFLPMDSTGQRRFAVVPFGDDMVLFEKLENDRDQLWAEAMYKYEQGDVEWSNIEAAAEDSKQYVKINDDWELFESNFADDVEKGLAPVKDDHHYLTTKQIYRYAEMDQGHVTRFRADNMREYLRVNGWWKKASWVYLNGKQIRNVWVKLVE